VDQVVDEYEEYEEEYSSYEEEEEEYFDDTEPEPPAKPQRPALILAKAANKKANGNCNRSPVSRPTSAMSAATTTALSPSALSSARQSPKQRPQTAVGSPGGRRFGSVVSSRHQRSPVGCIGNSIRGWDASAPDIYSPGPIYRPKQFTSSAGSQFSSLSGDAPRATFGNGECRPALTTTISPGPGALNLRDRKLPGSFTYQAESKLRTNARATVGNEVRTTPMAPKYTDALYNTSTKLGKGTNVGNANRFPGNSVMNNPAPDAYRIRPFLGEQANARHRTYPGKSFGLIGQRSGDPPTYESTRPGPGSYGTEKLNVDALGGRIQSARHRTSPVVGIGKGNRQPLLSTCSPGPAAYLVP